jgi:hypothetical protein
MLEVIAHDPSFWDMVGTVLACAATFVGLYALDRGMRDAARDAAQRRADDALLAPPQDWLSPGAQRPALPKLRP